MVCLRTKIRTSQQPTRFSLLGQRVAPGPLNRRHLVPPILEGTLQSNHFLPFLGASQPRPHKARLQARPQVQSLRNHYLVLSARAPQAHHHHLYLRPKLRSHFSVDLARNLRRHQLHQRPPPPLRRHPFSSSQLLQGVQTNLSLFNSPL